MYNHDKAIKSGLVTNETIVKVAIFATLTICKYRRDPKIHNTKSKREKFRKVQLAST